MDDMDIRNMYSDFAVNKYLHTVASCWILLISVYMSAVFGLPLLGLQIKQISVAHGLGGGEGRFYYTGRRLFYFVVFTTRRSRYLSLALLIIEPLRGKRK